MFEIHIHHHHHFDGNSLEKIMSALDDLKTAVSASNSVAESAITLLNGLHQKLEDAITLANAQGTTQALTDLAKSLSAETTALSQAVVDNAVDVAPAPAPAPTPVPSQTIVPGTPAA